MRALEELDNLRSEDLEIANPLGRVGFRRKKGKRTKYAVVEDFAYRHCYGHSFFVFGYNRYEKKPQV